jgi:hypothetical protein
MLSPVHAPDLRQERSRCALRTDKKRQPLTRISRRRSPDVGPPASLLCDVLLQPAGKAAENGYLIKLSSVCHLCIGNYTFALDYGCVHPGMPLSRKHFRRSRDAPIWWKSPELRTPEAVENFVKDLSPSDEARAEKIISFLPVKRSRVRLLLALGGECLSTHLAGKIVSYHGF